MPRQRWRLRYERDRSAAGLTQREEAEAWSDAIARSGLPFVSAGEPARPRLSLGVPLPAGCLALDEPLDLLLHERRAAHEVRTSLDAVAPTGHLVTAVHDVWLGAPALQAAGRAVDYAIRAEGAQPGALGAATAALLAATELPRERVRGSRTIAYDLRPLIESIVVDVAAGSEFEPDALRPGAPPVIRFRARLDPDRGVARPDELIAALGEQLGTPIVATEVVRTHVWLSDDVIPPLAHAAGV
jgi:radical SAM-linked protein